MCFLSQAQQEVPSWLEEFAFSSGGPTSFNNFASTDSRRVGGFILNLSTFFFLPVSSLCFCCFRVKVEDLSRTTAHQTRQLLLLLLQLMMTTGNNGDNVTAHPHSTVQFALYRSLQLVVAVFLFISFNFLWPETIKMPSWEWGICRKSLSALFGGLIVEVCLNLFIFFFNLI